MFYQEKLYAALIYTISDIMKLIDLNQILTADYDVWRALHLPFIQSFEGDYFCWSTSMSGECWKCVFSWSMRFIFDFTSCNMSNLWVIYQVTQDNLQVFQCMSAVCVKGLFNSVLSFLTEQYLVYYEMSVPYK